MTVHPLTNKRRNIYADVVPFMYPFLKLIIKLPNNRIRNHVRHLQCLRLDFIEDFYIFFKFFSII